MKKTVEQPAVPFLRLYLKRDFVLYKDMDKDKKNKMKNIQIGKNDLKNYFIFTIIEINLFYGEWYDIVASKHEKLVLNDL